MTAGAVALNNIGDLTRGAVLGRGAIWEVIALVIVAISGEEGFAHDDVGKDAFDSGGR